MVRGKEGGEREQETHCFGLAVFFNIFTSETNPATRASGGVPVDDLQSIIQAGQSSLTTPCTGLRSKMYFEDLGLSSV